MLKPMRNPPTRDWQLNGSNVSHTGEQEVRLFICCRQPVNELFYCGDYSLQPFMYFHLANTFLPLHIFFTKFTDLQESTTIFFKLALNDPE